MFIKLVFHSETLGSVLHVRENCVVFNINIKVFKLKVVQTVCGEKSLKGARRSFYETHKNPCYSAVDVSRQSSHLLCNGVAEDF